MDKEILCPFNLFSLNQQIYLCEEDKQIPIAVTNMKNLVAEMLHAGELNNVSTYHLVGNSLMAKKLAQELKTTYCLEYGIIDDDIKVKVN